MIVQRALLATLLCLGAATALADTPPPQLGVQGEGFVEATPDIVVVDVTVRHTATALNEAKREVDAISKAVIRAADLHGVKNDDLQASKIQAAPDYDWKDGQRQLRGQQVSRQFELRLRDIERYGALIQALADARVTEINGIRTEFSRREALENDALKQAIANARSKADAMAAAAGSAIAGIVSLNESGVSAGPRPYEMRANVARAQMADGGADNDSLMIGKQRITKTVEVIFRLN